MCGKEILIKKAYQIRHDHVKKYITLDLNFFDLRVAVLLNDIVISMGNKYLNSWLCLFIEAIRLIIGIILC